MLESQKKNKRTDLSKTNENNISFFSISYEQKNNKSNKNEKKKIFEVFHKNEKIFHIQNKLENNIQEKYFSFYYKCIYCGKKFNNINAFEIHMKIHVSYK